MKYSKAVLTQTAIVSIALFITGKFTFEKIYNFFEPKVAGIIFNITEVDQKLDTSLLFAIALALIPVFLLFLWRVTPIVALNKKAVSVLVVLVLMVVAIWIRQNSVASYYTSLRRNPMANFSNNNQYPTEPANFVYYMFLGLCIGCMLCYLLFRAKKSK